MYRVYHNRLGACYYVPKQKCYITYDLQRQNFLIYSKDLSKKIRVPKDIKIVELEKLIANGTYIV